ITSVPTSRQILLRHPIPELPGYETRTILLDYAPGYKAPLHTHPAAGPNYVIEGTVISQWGENGKTSRFGAGDAFLDYANELHYVGNGSETERAKIVVTYVIKIDEENVKWV
ncbi:hypothetical protein AC579_4718, partial [Pseudocercospora musae]